MEQIKYTDEIIMLGLMHHFGYTVQQADRLVEFYRRNDELDTLVALIEAKQTIIETL